MVLQVEQKFFVFWIHLNLVMVFVAVHLSYDYEVVEVRVYLVEAVLQDLP